MKSINKATILGNVTRDPELRYTPSGVPVVKFSIATNKTWLDKNTKEKKESVEFHNVVFWQKSAEIISQYVKKGNKIYIEGHLQTRDYEDKDKVKRYVTEIVGDEFVLLNNKLTTGEKVPDVVVDEEPVSRPTDSSGSEIKDIVIPEDLPF